MIQNPVKTFVLFLAIVLAVAIGSIVWVQNSLLFYPNTSIFNWSPDDRAVSISSQRGIEEENIRITRLQQERVEEEQRDIMIPDPRGGISAFYIHNFPGKDFLLYCHGTSGNIYDRKYVFDLAQEQQLNLLLFDYHGYGKSKSYPSVEGILKDGLTAYDFLRNKKNVPGNKIIPWGESLGGAVAAYIARNREVKGVVLMATFSSMPNLLNTMESFGWARYPLSLITRITLHPLDTARWVSKVKAPIVVMHSLDDDYISYECGVENFNIAKEPKLLIQIEGKHISPEITPEKITQALTFIQENQVN